jgi:hypothetical protein
MQDTENKSLILTLITNQLEAKKAWLMIESVRSFGGSLAGSQIWVFHPPELDISKPFAVFRNVSLAPLNIDDPYKSYEFSSKIFAMAAAEEMMNTQVRQVVWLDCAYMMLKPVPIPFLAPALDLALRPVHIRNIGSPAAEPPDGYWRAIYKEVGLDTIPDWIVESFVDRQMIRPYFNVSAFAFNPELKMMGLCREHFKRLVGDRSFQARCRSDKLHRIFLHQAVLSAMITKLVTRERIHTLPTAFAYPLHLHKELIAAGRAVSINEVDSLLYDYEGLPDVNQPYFRVAPAQFKEWLTEKLKQLR